MTESDAPRVAVYLDFDNIVISRYDQIHGRNSFQRDKTAGFHTKPGRLTEATVDVSAIIDFASSFGTLVLTRAYADWSADVNAEYQGQLAARPFGGRGVSGHTAIGTRLAASPMAARRGRRGDRT